MMFAISVPRHRNEISVGFHRGGGGRVCPGLQSEGKYWDCGGNRPRDHLLLVSKTVFDL